jgi:hypothetical protein
MRLTVPLLMLLVMASLPLAHASSTLTVTSSALPVAFVGEAYTFVATSSAPVSSWSIAPIGSGLSVSYTAGSSQAVVSGTLSAGTQTFNLTASGATATITDPNGTVGSSFPITAGQFIPLDSGASITPTYTTLTWQPYGC